MQWAHVHAPHGLILAFIGIQGEVLMKLCQLPIHLVLSATSWVSVDASC